jgi:hypothetical protein
MMLFSPKARRMLDQAVGLLPNQSQRDLWRDWASAHPHARQPSGPRNDGGPPMPEHIFAIASVALDAMQDRLLALQAESTEHDVYVIDNDLSQLKAIRVTLDEDRRVHA